MGEITIFKDAITENALKEIKDKSKFFVKEIKNKSEFGIIYAHYQEIRKIRIAINKKSKELIKAAKSDFELQKQIIVSEEKRILDIISPIEGKLQNFRETWEESERLIAEKKAKEIAEKQKAEFGRQEIIRLWDQAHMENDAFDQKIADDLRREVESERLRVEAGKLKQREEELNAREKELELQEAPQNTKGDSSILPVPVALLGVTAKEASENFNSNTLAMANVFKDFGGKKEEYEIITCPSCKYKLSPMEGHKIKAVNKEGEPTVFRIFGDNEEAEEFLKRRIEPQIKCPVCYYRFNSEEGQGIKLRKTEEWHEDQGCCIFFHFDDFASPPDVSCTDPLNPGFEETFWTHYIEIDMKPIFEQAARIINEK